MAIEKINLKFSKIDDDAEKTQAISELRNLLASPGWLFLKKVIDENIKFKELTILEDINSKEVLYNEDDRLRDQRKFLMQLVKMPVTQLHLLGDEEEEINEDPYFSNEEMEKLRDSN